MGKDAFLDWRLFLWNISYACHGHRCTWTSAGIWFIAIPGDYIADIVDYDLWIVCNRKNMQWESEQNTWN